MIFGGVVRDLNDDVPAMGPELGGFVAPIPSAVIREREQERLLGVPTALVMQADRRIQQSGANGGERIDQPASLGAAAYKGRLLVYRRAAAAAALA